MKELGLASALAVLLSLFSPKTQAEFGAPYLTPLSPTAGETLSISINVYQQEYCDAILSGPPGYPRITQEGNEITLTFFGTRYESMDTCAYHPGVVTRPLGNYAAGSYLLTVNLYYLNGGGEPQTDTLGVVPFIVASVEAEAVAVPAWSIGAAVACIVALSCLSFLALRRRRSARPDLIFSKGHEL